MYALLAIALPTSMLVATLMLFKGAIIGTFGSLVYQWIKKGTDAGKMYVDSISNPQVHVAAVGVMTWLSGQLSALIPGLDVNAPDAGTVVVAFVFTQLVHFIQTKNKK